VNSLQANLLNQNRIAITDEITLSTFFYVREVIATKMTEGFPELTFHISCSGGLVSAGLDIYDLIRFYEGPTVGVVHSIAASMGAVVLQACDWRVATPHSDILIHNLNTQGISLDIMRNEIEMSKLVRELEDNQEMVYDILIGRTGRSRDEIMTISALDLKMNVEEALAFGLIDQIAVKESHIKSIQERS
jgi:ATP-dependent Clp protease protease subunit